MTGSPVRPGDGLLHPLPLAAIAVLVLNDHLLKPAFPGLVTGKLSDVAGLAFFPLFLVALWELARSRRWSGPSSRALVVACLATGLVFAFVKLTGPGALAYRHGLGLLQWPFRALGAVLSGGSAPSLHRVTLARDPSDLVALPALFLAYFAGYSRIRATRAG